MARNEARELVGQYFEALNASDHGAVLELMGEDVVLDTEAGREIGVERFRWFLAERARHFRETYGDVVILAEEGGVRAAAEYTVRGKYLADADGLPAATGQSYSFTAGVFFEIDSGRITRVSECRSTARLAASLASR